MNKNDRGHMLRESFQSSLPTALALICAIAFFFVIYRFGTIIRIISKLINILMPIIIGIAIAYLVNPIVEKVEKACIYLWEDTRKKTLKKKTRMRLPAILITLCMIFWVIYLLASLVVPQLHENITYIINQVPSQITTYYLRLLKFLENNEDLRQMVYNSYQNVMGFVTTWIQKDMFGQVSVIISSILGVVGVVSNFIIGVIVAIYLLLSKETFKRQFELLLHVFFSDKVADKIRETIKESDHIFGGFISGKLIDSLIIGALCFVGALILRLPYPALISVIVGVTNVIPFFGPYIGAIPSALLIFLDSPAKCLVFVIFVLVLQQFDGNILGPKILGESTGLSPFWVIFAILLGSGLFGIVGMIVGVPAFGVIYYLIKSFVHYRLAVKEQKAMVESNHLIEEEMENREEE